MNGYEPFEQRKVTDMSHADAIGATVRQVRYECDYCHTIDYRPATQGLVVSVDEVAEALWVADDPWTVHNGFDPATQWLWADADDNAREVYRQKAKIVIERLGLEVSSGQQIPGLAVTNPIALREWMQSDEHSHPCAAWSEGQRCCLDRLIDGE